MLRWCNPVTLPSSLWFARVFRIYSSLCLCVRTLCVSCSLVWHWLYEHACWLWECVFLLPPDQFQRKLPAAIPWPGPYPLLSTWGLPPSVEWLVASLIPLSTCALPVCDFHHMQHFLWHELYIIYLHIGCLHLELGFKSAAANSKCDLSVASTAQSSWVAFRTQSFVLL